MYRDGNGVKKDYVQAYMWLSLAVAAGDEGHAVVDELAAKMTPKQIAEGKRLVAEWKPISGPSKQ